MAPRWLLPAALALLVLTGGYAHAQPEPAEAAGVTLTEARRSARAAVREQDDALAEQAKAALEQLAASEDAELAGRAEYELGRLAESFGTALEAVEHYRRSLDIDPSGPEARHALSRARNLEEEIAAGVDDAIREELERIRRAQLDDEALIAELDALLENVPPGRQRAEICNWIGTKLVFEVEEPARAWPYYAQIPTMPNINRDLLRTAYEGIIRSAPEAGQIAQGREVLLTAFDAYPDSVAEHEAARLLDELRDAQQRVVAWWFSLVSLALLGVLWVLNRGWSAFSGDIMKEWRPWKSLLVLVYFFGGATVVGGLWDAQNLEPMLTTIPGVLIVHVLAGSIRWSDQRLDAIPGALTVLVVIGATFGSLYLALDFQDATYLLGL